MSLIAEFRIESQVMKETTTVFPEIEYHQEEVHLTEEGDVKSIVWVSCDDFDAFESALQTDPDVKDYDSLTEIQTRRLYRLTIAEEAADKVLYPKAVESDIVYLDVTGTHERTHFRVRAPTLEAVQDIRQTCRERGIPFHLQRLYREEPDEPADKFELTSSQYEVLVRAHKRGYFEQPRCVTLEELAEEFSVSSSALGRRMRRAMDALIDQTLRSNTDDADDHPSEGRGT